MEGVSRNDDFYATLILDPSDASDGLPGIRDTSRVPALCYVKPVKSRSSRRRSSEKDRGGLALGSTGLDGAGSVNIFPARSAPSLFTSSSQSIGCPSHSAKA